MASELQRMQSERNWNFNRLLGIRAQIAMLKRSPHFTPIEQKELDGMIDTVHNLHAGKRDGYESLKDIHLFHRIMKDTNQ